MSGIKVEAKNLRKLLDGERYSIDYYQREYKWGEKQIDELLADLIGAFEREYNETHELDAILGYNRYFLGSIITSVKDNRRYLVDGQQRLTSLTLLLIMLRNLQEGHPDAVDVSRMIRSIFLGKPTYNIAVEERNPVIDALFNGESYDASGKAESVQNIAVRYEDLRTGFPYQPDDRKLTFFIYWLIENVEIIEIITSSEADAYTVFETMNDRGLSLSPTDMLKGFVLASINDSGKRDHANRIWRKWSDEFRVASKEGESAFLKAWFRSQYAEKITPSSSKGSAEDFERISTEFHRWFRETHKRLGIDGTDGFYQFIERDYDFYARQYQLVQRAAREPVTGLEHVLYPEQQRFTLQYIAMLSPLRVSDDEDTLRRKVEAVAICIDIMLNRRIWNYRSIQQSYLDTTIFNLMKAIRGMGLNDLVEHLTEHLETDGESFHFGAHPEPFRMHQTNQGQVKHILARLTHFVERESGFNTHYLDYIATGIKNSYEVEHIWADHAELHEDEFPNAVDFATVRNRIGDLLLLPKQFNASYGDKPFETKRPHYFGQNLLAKSLDPQAYDKHPGFRQFVERTGLPFRWYEHFGRRELEERQKLYKQIAELIWDPRRIREQLP